MKNTIYLFLLFMLPELSLAQSTADFGDISVEEINMTNYEPDQEAEAVIFFDKGKSYFYDYDGGYNIRFTRHKRIKVFKNSGTDYAEVSIPYYVDGYGRTENVASIKAATYNYSNGALETTNLSLSTVFDEKLSERWRVKKFVFPNVQDGSILEFIYELETPFHFNLPDWTFQDDIPTIYSEYQAHMIPFYEYVFRVQGVNRFDKQTSVKGNLERKWGSVTEHYGIASGGIVFHDLIHTYALKDVPAFKDESFISSKNDYIIKMDFQLAKFYSPTGADKEIISTWPKLNEELLKHEKFGKYIKKSSVFSKKILQSLQVDQLSQEEKAEYLVNYVKSNYSWNGYYGKYSTQSVKQFQNSKKGSDADINLFLIGLLRESGIPVDPVAISTRNHGKIGTEYPFDYHTNYVIALIKTESPFLADATEPLLPARHLPLRCANETGLVVNDLQDVQWVSLDNQFSSLEKTVISIKIDTTNYTQENLVSIQSTNYDAYRYRSKFEDDEESLKDNFEKNFGNISTIKTGNYENIEKPYTLSFLASNDLETLGSHIIIKPLLNLPITENMLKQETRSYPVDFTYPFQEVYESRIQIPNNYKVSNLPEDLKINNDLVEITISYVIHKDQITLLGNYNFKKSIYQSADYSKLKYYMETIVKKFNEEIVLEKT